MIDFDRKPTEKTEDEKEFDSVNEKYSEKFGAPYTFRIGLDFSTFAEAISDILRRIAENDPQPPPDYNPKDVY